MLEVWLESWRLCAALACGMPWKLVSVRELPPLGRLPSDNSKRSLLSVAKKAIY
jgi:hypothetical protein